MTLLISISLLVERLLEVIKEAFPVLSGRKGLLWLLSMLLGTGLCFAFGADLFAQYGLAAAWPWAGPLLSGIICGAGSNLLHDVSDALDGKSPYLQTGLSGISPALETSLSEDADEGVM